MVLRQEYEQSLKKLFEDVMYMGVLIEEAFRNALKALKTNNRVIAEEVIIRDNKIDSLQVKIEDECVKIIARQSPVASDLREVITSLKIVSELERIGDHARHLAKMVGKLSDKQLKVAMPHIETMISTGLEMIHGALRAFVDRDAGLAEQVARLDDSIDQHHKELFSKCLVMIREAPEKAEQEITLLFLNRFLERLGDRVTNICEWVIYGKSGKHLELNK
ncbi:MAG: phosphate signaling complex protein PhoU [Spirochaetales bacterium]|nr:phosphate signaling complex protein PhoU [Spirochaetales bacterium]